MGKVVRISFIYKGFFCVKLHMKFDMPLNYEETTNSNKNMNDSDRRGHVVICLPSCYCPVGWGCRIHRLLLCRGVRPPPPNECPGYDTKQSDGEVPVMLELWGMRGTLSLPSLPDPLWPGVVAPDRTLSMG